MVYVVHERKDGRREYLADRPFTAWIADVRQARPFADDRAAHDFMALRPEEFGHLGVKVEAAAPPGG